MLPLPPIVLGWVGVELGVAALVTVMTCAAEPAVVMPLPFFTTEIVQADRQVKLMFVSVLISIQLPLSI
jgi:hypothetical protein